MLRSTVFLVWMVPIVFASVRAAEPPAVQFGDRNVPADVAVKAMKSSDVYTRRAAISAIAFPSKWPKDASKLLIPALAERLKDKDDGVRFAAAETLASTGTDAVAALPALMDAAKDANELVRSRVVWAIRDIGPKAEPSTKVLIELLADKCDPIATAASVALGNIGAPAVPALTEALSSPLDRVRENAADALFVVGPGAKSALPALRKLLADKAERVARAVRVAIDEIEEKPDRAWRMFPGQMRGAQAARSEPPTHPRKD